MTNATLGRLLERLLQDREGSEGFWHGQREDVAVYVVSDEEHDRMRIMSPIGDLRVTDSGFLSILLQANFDRALDAKYALRKKELWSVFMHPLSTLVPDDLGIYIDQVVHLVKNTGTTYASSDLIFGISDDDDRLDLDYAGEDDEDEDGDEAGDGDEAVAESDEDEDEDDDATDEVDDDDEEFDFGDDDDEGEEWRKGGAGP